MVNLSGASLREAIPAAPDGAVRRPQMPASCASVSVPKSMLRDSLDVHGQSSPKSPTMPILVPSPPSALLLPRERWRFYVDESGQMRGDGDHRPLLAGVAVPAADERLISDLTLQVRSLLCSGSAAGPIKGAHLHAAPQAYELVATTMKRRWGFDYVCLKDGLPGRTQALRDLIEGVEEMLGGRSAWAWQALGVSQTDHRVKALQDQLRRAKKKQPTYLAMLFMLLTTHAAWFRQKNFFPRVEVVLDEGKLRKQDKELLNFVVAVAFFGAFPETLPDWPRRVALGLETGFSCRTGSDLLDPGLVLADAVAYAASRVERGEDGGRQLFDVIIKMGGQPVSDAERFGSAT